MATAPVPFHVMGHVGLQSPFHESARDVGFHNYQGNLFSINGDITAKRVWPVVSLRCLQQIEIKISFTKNE